MKHYLLSLPFALLLMSGCSGENSGMPSQGNNSSGGDNNTYSQPPVITSLSKAGLSKPDNTVAALHTCFQCDMNKTVFTWIVDRNNDGIFSIIDVNGEPVDNVTEETHMSLNEDYSHRIRLSAIAYSPDGAASYEEEYAIYEPQVIQQVDNQANAGRTK